MSKPLVSICIITYQHAHYIAQAVEGVLSQKTDFPVEILIGEDESTDGTREVCLDYARRYSDRVRLFLRNRNEMGILVDGRPSGGFNFVKTLEEAEGEFIALCEGDDYWTDPKKLQHQIEYLRKNPDCVGCFHDTTLVDADGTILQESYFQSPQEKFTQKDVLESLQSREPTCSLVFRRTALASPLPEWYLRRPSDLYLDILLTNNGKLGFLKRNMGAYRKHNGGIWSGQRQASQIVELIIRYKFLLLEPLFVKRYGELLTHKIDEFQAALFTAKDANGELARLSSIVEIQTQTIQATTNECDRLYLELKTFQTKMRQAAETAQSHIDNLKRQLDLLGATSREQDNFIARLKQEQNRLSLNSERLSIENAHHLKIIAEQKNYIEILEKTFKVIQQEKNQSEASRLSADNIHYVNVIKEQNEYISLLQKQLNRNELTDMSPGTP